MINGAMLLAIGGVLWLFFMPLYRQGEPAMTGKNAPAFSFAMNGKPMQLSDLRGKVVVLNFWFSTCPPCIEEAAALNRLHTQISPQGGMVLGVDVNDSEADYQRFLREHSVNFPTFLEPDDKIHLAYGSTVFPETYIIDRSGRIARKVIGPQDWDHGQNYAFIESLLQKN